jgi:putative nucleotidyltransferase with HDIG domain
MDKVLESQRGLDKIVSTIGDLPATPAIIATLMNLTSDLNTDIEKITRAIMADQSLTAKVLKISNSSFYGRAREVKTLREAIVILGFMTLHSLVIATSTQSLYRKSIDDGVSGKLWEHALGTAIASRMIAKSISRQGVEEAFIAGLLHDIGKLVMTQKMNDDYQKIVKEVEESGGCFHEFEERAFGFNHADVGSMLLNKWSFPDELAQAVKDHHNTDYDDQDRPLLSHIISLGNFMAKNLDIGFTDCRMDDLSAHPSAIALNLDAEKLEEFQQELAQHFADEKELFRLS